MEERQYEQSADGTWHSHLEVVEHTKTEAGCRTIYVVSSALELFAKVKEHNVARKTCLTKIADNPNINLKDAMQYSGHKDVKTYIKHYCFSRYSDEHQRKELEKCLNT